MGIHTYFKSFCDLERIERCPGKFKFESHNVASHSWKVTQYAQFLGTVEEKCGAIIDWKLLYEKALNHDYPEFLTGDIKTPVKYASPEMREMLAKVEAGMLQAFIDTEFPDEFKEIYREKLKEGKDETLEGLILAVADKLDQVYEAFFEIQRGNTDKEFVKMYRDALLVIKSIDLKCVDYIFENILIDMMNEDMNSAVDIKQITEEVLAQ